MMYPVEIHVTSCTVAPSDPIMCGIATLTIDESIVPMSVPNVIDTVTSHLFGFARVARSVGKVAAAVTSLDILHAAPVGTMRACSERRSL